MTHIRNITMGLGFAACIARSTDADILAGLGLTDDTAETQTVTAGEVGSVEAVLGTIGDEAEAATKAPRTEIKITGDIAQKVRKGLPQLERKGFGGGGKTGSKYPFADLAAPIGPDADGEYEYASFTVLLTDVENADANKLRGAIQAATAAQNKQAKADGSGLYFKSFSELGDNGEYIGSSVYRVDGTADKAE